MDGGDVKKSLGTWVLSLLVVACVTGAPRGGPQDARVGSPAPNAAGAASAGSATVEGYAAAIKAASDRTDHESDSKVRAGLAAEASTNADACLALDPQAAAC